MSRDKKKSGKIAKVPVIIQQQALECGAAGLAMIMAYYGKWVPLEKVRVDCGVGRDGSSADNIVKAAEKYGFIAKGYKMEPETLAKKGSFPCIVHWEFNHFIVVRGIKGDKVYINDPARGNVVLSMKEFDEGFTGICLFFAPDDDFEPSGKKQSMFHFIRKNLRGTAASVFLVVFISIAAAVLSSAGPILSKSFIDDVLGGNDELATTLFFIALWLVFIVQFVISVINNIHAYRINGKFASIGNLSFIWKILKMPMEFFAHRLPGDLLLRQEENASVAKTLVFTFAPLLINGVMMLVYSIIMLNINAFMAIIGITATIINMFISNYISKKRINITRVLLRDEGKLYSTTLSGIEMIESIKSSGAENGFFEKWAGHQANVISQKTEYEEINHYIGIIPSIISTVAGAVVLAFGIGATMNGNFSIGYVMEFQGFLTAFTGPAMTLISSTQTIVEMRTQMERIESIMDYPIKEKDSKETDAEREYKKIPGNVEMKGVFFKYSPFGKNVIEDFSFSVKQGQSVAIVGKSGSGKSTVASLLAGLYEPLCGEIIYNGKPFGEYDKYEINGSVAVVDQKITLFNDTISNNIKMWDSSIEDFEMIMAAKDAQIHDSIMKREDGYQTVIPENGSDLSGGERQRLEIARALSQDPTILILDEATSALDTQTESDVIGAIKKRGITCIVIAHRLSTIKQCDEIIVLDEGKIAEKGTHEDLMKKDGVYASLIKSE